MQPVTIYTQPLCGFCTRALHLLASKNAPVTEIDTARVRGARAEMTQRANGRTSTPQIFIGDTHVGGCDDLYALERAGKLDALLQG
ncbi:glutaredoxin 3 [Jannaschia formosa]|uniref:glutaredoxin 3 n=1 Tax=Jannaschia formosa TaxID=2259592 RepID=UPI000E1BF2A0|nr:glutaredoxin 3 [Jannaschia formosa]TFL19248.1 glutaredoxin 3 [Jannaschia formosa]